MNGDHVPTLAAQDRTAARRPEGRVVQMVDDLWPAPAEPKMGPPDMAKVLTACSGYDGREVPPVMVRAWWSKLGGFYTLAECLEAVDHHYDVESRRMMPADIIRYHGGDRSTVVWRPHI